MTSKISPEAFKLFFELSNDLLSVSDFNGYFVEVNQKWLNTTGYTFAELTQCPFLEFVHPEDKEKTLKETQDLLSGKPEAIRFENRYLGKNGNVIWLEWNSVTDRERGLIYSVARDITDKKKIIQENEQLSKVVNQVSEGVVITNQKQEVEWVNQGFCDTSGYTLKEVQGKTLGYFLQGDQTSYEHIQKIKEGVRSRKPFTQKILNFRKDGSTFWNELSITPIFDEEGSLVQYYGIQKDVSARVEAEIALERFSNNLKALHLLSTEPNLNLSQLFNQYLKAGCSIFDLPRGIISQIEDDHCEILAIESQLDKDLQPQTTLPLHETYCKKIGAENQTLAFINAAQAPPISQISTPLNLAMETFIGAPIWLDGKIYGSLNFSSPHPKSKAFQEYEIEFLELMAADLSKRIASDRSQTNKLQAEQKLRVSEERYRSVVNALSAGIVVHDLNDTILMCNDSAAGILGLTKNQLLGKDSYDPRWKALKPDGSPIRPEDHPSIVTGTTGQPVTGFLMSVYKNEGERAIISVNSEPIHDDQGKMYGVVASFTDVTKEKEALESLAKSEENLRITLNSIGDAVISTDKFGNIVSLNRIAEQLTGWKVEEAYGKPIQEVFNIVSVRSGESVNNPVEQVLKEGKNVELANHTILISKNKNEFQISDSAAPIINQQGDILGVVMVFRDVSVEYAIQEELKASEERYKKLTETAPVGIIVHIDGKIVYSNPFAIHLTEAHHDSLIGQNALELIHPKSKEKAAERIRQLMMNEIPFADPIEETILSQQGNEKEVLVSGMKIEYKGQDAIFNVFSDISKLKSTEKALIQSQNRITNIANSVPGLLLQYKLNPDGSDDLLYVSDQSKAVWGVSKEEAMKDIGQVWSNIIEEDVAATQESILRSAQDLSFWDQKYRVLAKNGDLKHLHARGYPNLQADGSIIWDTIIIDITDKEKVIQERKESEEKYRFIIENTSEIFILWDQNLNIEFISPSIQQLLGYTEEEYKKFGAFENVPPEDHPIVKQSTELLLKGEAIEEMEHRVFKKNGEIVWLANASKTFRAATGNISKIITTSRDITAKKEAELLLLKQQNRLSNVIEGTNTGTWEWNVQTGETVYNERWAEIIGYQLDELMPISSKTWENHVFKEDLEISHFALEKHYKGDTDYYDIQVRMRHKDGSTVWVWDRGKVISWTKEGAPLMMFGTHTDITKQKEAEFALENSYLRLQNKNKELEQFVYIATHDLKEPLNTVAGVTRLIEDDISNKNYPIDIDLIDLINQATARMSNLIKGLLDYGRIGQDLKLSEIDLNELLKDVQASLASSIQKTQAQIQIGSLPIIRGYKTELLQLFQNLISNAIKYHREGILPLIKIHCEKKYHYWQFSVSDNGIGIDPKYSEKIFEIFQRLHNKNEYEGTGIGLANCRKIVDLHQGQIWVNSMLDEGSTFFFTIPFSIK